MTISQFDISGKLLVMTNLLWTTGIFHNEMTSSINDETFRYLNDGSTPIYAISYNSLSKCFHKDSIKQIYKGKKREQLFKIHYSLHI